MLTVRTCRSLPRSPSTQRPPLNPTSLRPATRSLRPVCPAHGEEKGVGTRWRGRGVGGETPGRPAETAQRQHAWPDAGSQRITYLPSGHYSRCCGASLSTPPLPALSESPKARLLLKAPEGCAPPNAQGAPYRALQLAGSRAGGGASPGALPSRLCAPHVRCYWKKFGCRAGFLSHSTPQT